MRVIDMLDLRWHKGEPTWEIIDELLEMIDAAPSEDEVEARVEEAHADGYDDGRSAGYDEGRSAGYDEGYMEGEWAADDRRTD